jgi:hypothetical protein
MLDKSFKGLQVYVYAVQELCIIFRTSSPLRFVRYPHLRRLILRAQRPPVGADILASLFHVLLDGVGVEAAISVLRGSGVHQVTSSSNKKLSLNATISAPVETRDPELFVDLTLLDVQPLSRSKTMPAPLTLYDWGCSLTSLSEEDHPVMAILQEFSVPLIATPDVVPLIFRLASSCSARMQVLFSLVKKNAALPSSLLVWCTV